MAFQEQVYSFYSVFTAMGYIFMGKTALCGSGCYQLHSALCGSRIPVSGISRHLSQAVVKEGSGRCHEAVPEVRFLSALQGQHYHKDASPAGLAFYFYGAVMEFYNFSDQG